jgi:hypothetical protein
MLSYFRPAVVISVTEILIAFVINVYILTPYFSKIISICVFFFVIPFYLQSVLVHSANYVKSCIHVYSGM